MDARSRWQSSGLSDDQAGVLGFEELSAEATRALAPNFHAVKSLLLPYFSKAGARTDFFRVRYLDDLPGWSGLVEKPQRYAQPTGTLNRSYFPPLTDWTILSVDVSRSLFLTEGELKAAAATARGFPTVGLGGVDMWRAQKRGIGLLPDLEEIAWNGRRVCIVFDSDAHHNPNVVRAQLQLAGALTQAGAFVSFVSLPVLADGGKQGLDDYLVANTDEAFKALVAAALPFDEGRALLEMNEEVLLVRNPAAIYERATGNVYSRDIFSRLVYADRTYNEITLRGNPPTPSLKSKPLAERWLAWPGRAQVLALTYEPGKPRHTEDGRLNLWKGWGVRPCDGPVDLWRQLLDHLFTDAEAGVREWFEKWLAYPLQHPGEKMYTAACMWGTARGTGKTLVGYTMARIYGENAQEIRNTDLHGNFNDWAKNKQFIIGDEVTGSDRRKDADRLKGLVTQHTIRINPKYVPAYVLPDCINYYFTSQHPDALFIEDGERRYFVHEVQVDPLPMEFYLAYNDWYKSDAVGALFKYFLDMDLSGFNPKAAALVTAATQRMVEDTQSELGSWTRDLITNGVSLVRAGEVGAADLFTSKQLMELYKSQTDNGRGQTPAVMGRELHRLRIEQRSVRVGSMVHRLYAVRNRELWRAASSKEWADHFAQHMPDPVRVRF